MALYYYASMDQHDHDDIIIEGSQRAPPSSFKSFLAFINRRENLSLAIFGLWLTTCQVDIAIGHVHTNPNGIPSLGCFYLSTIFWLNPPFLYFLSRLRSIISQMNPSEISSYLSTNILTIGISSITPMMCLSLDTIKLASNIDYTQNVFDQCSGVFFPQFSICMFLFITMIIKVLIAPLSTTTITANELIKLNLSRRFISQGTLFGISFFLNLYPFANMDEGKTTDNIIIIIAWTATILAVMPISLEFFHTIFHTIFHRAHRTSLAPPQCPTSTSSSEISLSPTTASPRIQTKAIRRQASYRSSSLQPE